MDINHIDGNRTNNHPANMEPATRSQNLTHAYRVLRRPLSRSCPEPVLDKISTTAKQLRSAGMTFSAIALQLGVSQTTAFRAVKHKSRLS
ncbi:HNH endonuclease [Ralstonia solanacearum species complex bacterium KE101]|uniref:HNH endonuclease n=1 Tax=Ralstonia solanacearum species complex bacterium KE101 TaxID=3119587 RepID=UPI003B2810CD